MMTPTQEKLHRAHAERLGRIRSAGKNVKQDWIPVPDQPPAIKPAKVKTALVTQDEGNQPYISVTPTARSIQLAVCKFYGVTLIDMLSPRRDANIARPRQVAVYLCRHLTMLSMPKIGKMFGDRDHTTILAANRKIDRLVKEDQRLAEQVNFLSVHLTHEVAA